MATQELDLRPVIRMPQPPAPTNLVAEILPEGVSLKWQFAAHPRITGFRIYKIRPGQSPVLIGQANKPVLGVNVVRYIDEEPGTGQMTYRVTTIDASITSQEPGESDPIETLVIIY